MLRMKAAGSFDKYGVTSKKIVIFIVTDLRMF
jgi:hypothetical protein